jgi:eukaryotic-like serine/threonine-protein kinase
MDSSPVDEAWDTEDGASAPSDVPPLSSYANRTPAQILADLRHPHLIVMRLRADGNGFEPELAGGMSLAELNRSEAGWFPLPLRVGLRILLDALSGLSALHHATQDGNPLDFVHGEVTPSNIYVGCDGRGRLVPVVPAHWSEHPHPSADLMGYAAPERLLGDVFGQPADIFSAGVLLWEAITGKPLFRNWPLEAIVTQLIGRKVPYPIPFGDALWGVPLADVAMRALSVDPAERWAHVGALGAQIETIARGHLATSDEIAALVAGFAAGKGPTSVQPPAPLLAPPPAAPGPITSLAPTASSIQSPAEKTPSVTSLEVPVAEPAPLAEGWGRERSAPSAPRIWLPGQVNVSSAGAATPAGSADLVESWSGIAPASSPGASRRSKAIVWVAVSASLAVTAIAAYQLLDRSAETRSSATVLAPKVTAAGQPSAAAATGVMPAGTAPSATGNPPRPAAEGSGAANAPPVPTSITGSAPTGASVPATPVHRTAPPRPVTRSAPAPATPLTAAPPRQAAPPPAPSPAPAPPPAAKPKPKEDIFGI